MARMEKNTEPIKAQYFISHCYTHAAKRPRCSLTHTHMLNSREPVVGGLRLSYHLPPPPHNCTCRIVQFLKCGNASENVYKKLKVGQHLGHHCGTLALV